MSIFGWSLPPGCSSLPGEEDETPDHIACAKCAARLPLQATRSERWEEWSAYAPSDSAIAPGCVRFDTATQRHEYLADSGSTEFWDCPHCGHASTVLNAVYAEDIADNFANLHIPEILSKYPTWAVWEYAAMPSDVMDLPPGVAALARQEGLYHNRVWYWVERFHNQMDSTDCWTDGFGTTLSYIRSVYQQKLLLNWTDLQESECDRSAVDDSALLQQVATVQAACDNVYPHLLWQFRVNPLSGTVKATGTSELVPTAMIKLVTGQDGYTSALAMQADATLYHFDAATPERALTNFYYVLSTHPNSFQPLHLGKKL